MKIFVISLKRSPERRDNIKRQFDTLGLEFEFFDAIDGRSDPSNALFSNYNYAKRLWLTSGRMPSKGELGCYASHYLLWKACVELNESILVIEDDAALNDSLASFLSMIEEKVQVYGFLRLEPETDKCQLVTQEDNGMYQIAFMTNNFGGTRSYAIAPTAASKLLLGSKRWCMPVDNYIGSLYIHHMPSYLFKPFVVENPETFGTTIQLGEEAKAKWYRKIIRETYSLYRKFAMFYHNNKVKK
ncbi:MULTISPECIES: glycosyltransferase family 25 protein [unclassified Vibrio]|uniref:Glycosyltransferase family 25 protein n=4 Tax=Vibrio anguillarum TaxID=55601 RepID=A0AAW4BCI0_VIBAN|nr:MULTISPECIES: glycosyltransferase family 25 protein [unclassified Vibrio]MBF4434721.1 glycosyltransferase family 25 protein [Vibrio anguillarum]NAW90381.1 glycosyl transferase [Vibrio sp. V24_P1S3T111]OXX21370.1 glycosyl transferase [Vibrio sp. V05_P4A8T149]OXX25609.1 glycosyl transferase [Vibrio sp. V06_P1A73T115]OXX28623.1 glycosyl transferase [Vibrio sp. V14_P6S14T42]